MYHELTNAQLRRRRTMRVLGLLLAIALAFVMWAGIGVLQASAREQGAASLRTSITEAAKQCCAIEGSYPRTLQHLEDRYGVTINHEDYVVTYEWFADNVMPNVVVVPR